MMTGAEVSEWEQAVDFAGAVEDEFNNHGCIARAYAKIIDQVNSGSDDTPPELSTQYAINECGGWPWIQ